MAIRVQGHEIQRMREHLGLSVAQFAAVLAVHPSTVHRWEAYAQNAAPIDGVAASVILSLRDRLSTGGAVRREASGVGDEVARALVVGGALVGLVLLLKWLTDDRKK